MNGRTLTGVALTGERHGMLMALAFSHKNRNGTYWLFRCDCGVEKPIRAADVRRSKQTSCGCVHTTHGASRGTTTGGKVSPEYMSWRAMLARCNNPKAAGYENYGGRGIKVCDRWANDFAAFLADMGERPSLDHSLDKIDNDGDYKPVNCRWATTLEQNQKKRSLVMMTIDGETLCLAEWARRSGIPEATLRARVAVRGWDHERAVKTPWKPNRQAA